MRHKIKPRAPQALEQWLALNLRLYPKDLEITEINLNSIILSYHGTWCYQHNSLKDVVNPLIKVTSNEVEIGTCKFTGIGLSSEAYNAFADGYLRERAPSFFHPILRVYWELGRDLRDACEREANAH